MEKPRLPESFLDDLRARVPMNVLVERSIRLERAGRHWKGLCPFHGERNPSFAVYSNGYHCFGCGAHGDAIAWTMFAHRLPFLQAVAVLAAEVGLAAPRGVPHVRPEQLSPSSLRSLPPPASDAEDEERAERRKRAALSLFLEATPHLAGTPAESYLRARGIDLAVLGRQPRALRYHAACPNRESGRAWPALLAAVTDARGLHVATHRTWLAEVDGAWGKAPLRYAKMSLGRVRGGSIRLWRGASRKPLAEAAEGEAVVLGEGIETCLSIAVSCPDLRVLSAVSLGNMGGLVLPAAIGTVIIAADNDTKEEPRRMLQRAVNHFIAEGRAVRIARSPIGKDFNDALRAA